MCRDGIIIDPDETDDAPRPGTSVQSQRPTFSGSFARVDESTDDECILNRPVQKSTSELTITNESHQKSAAPLLSTSLGARAFYDEEAHSGDDDPFEDAEGETSKTSQSQHIMKQSQNMYVSAAVSLAYAGVPVTQKYIRGENLLSCWAMEEIEGNPDACIFEWLLCLDLKGFVPRYVLESVGNTKILVVDFTFDYGFIYFSFGRHIQLLCKTIWFICVNIVTN